MNALVIGGGHLGTFLKERLDPKYYYTGIMNYLTQEMLDDMNVKIVINTAGKISLEMCEKSPYQAFDCNVIQPLRLFRMIKDQIFIQLSSGCIWDGPYDESGHPFMVGSLATPACFYSWTKVSCEALMQREAGTWKEVSDLKAKASLFTFAFSEKYFNKIKDLREAY